MKRLLILLLSIIIFAVVANSQQLPQISLRHHNLFLNNPAVAGSTSSQEIKILHREQWAGFENAPTTSCISFHRELNTTNGLGGYIINDVTSPSSRFTINASYSYIIDMDDVFLAFGLSGSIVQYRLHSDILTYRDINDPVMAFNTEKRWRPEANIGLLLYSKRFYFGFAINQLLKSQFRPFSTGDLGEIDMSRHIYFMGQYDILSGFHKISPGLFIGYAKKSPVSAELNLSYSYQNSLMANLGYRLGDAFNIGIGYRFGRFSVAYSYDIVSSTLRNINSGSHEVMLGIEISTQQNTVPMFSSGSGSSGASNQKQSNKRLY